MVRAHEWSSARGPVLARRPWWAGAAPPPPPVRLSVASTGVFTVVVVTGDLGALTRTELELLAAERPLVGCVQLTLDLADVLSLGSAGAAVLLQVRRWCGQRGIELRLCGAAPSVERVLRAAGLDDLLDAPPTPLRQLAAIQSEHPALF